MQGRRIVAADLSRRSTVCRVIARVQPTHIIHLAGVTRLADAQQEPERAEALNINATRVLAEYASRTGAWMLFASTDFVFEGEAPGRQDEFAPTAPKTVYGQTKLRGEEEVLQHAAGCVARLSLLWGDAAQRPDGWSALANMLRAGEEVRAVFDEARTPLRFETASHHIMALATRQYRGLAILEAKKSNRLINLSAKLGTGSDRNRLFGRWPVLTIPHRRRAREMPLLGLGG